MTLEKIIILYNKISEFKFATNIAILNNYS